MAPWSTRRLTLLFLVVFVLSMVAPAVPSGLAEDLATPEVTPEITPDVVVDPTATEGPPSEPPLPVAPADEPVIVVPTEAPVPTATVEEPVTSKPMEAPPVPDEEEVPPVAPAPRAVSEPSIAEELPAELGSLTIVVTDLDTNAPISGALVAVNWVDAGVTNEDGRFVASDIPFGQNHVEVSAEGYFGSSGWFDVYGVVEYSLSLEPWPQPGVLTVTVVDAVSTLPVPGAVITVTWPDVTGQTGDTGVWVSEELPAGLTYLDVSATGYFQRTVEVTIDGATLVTVVLEPILPGTLTVEVVTLGTGDPVFGASVVVYTYYGHEYVTEGTTGDDGLFSTALPGGNYTVEVSAPTFFTGYAYPFVNGDTSVPIVLEPLPLPGVLTVTVLDAGTTEPISGASVSVYDLNWSTVASGLSDTAGVVVTGELPGGEYFVEVSATGYYGGSDRVLISGATPRTFSLKPLPKSGDLTITVVDQVTLQAIPGASVRVSDAISEVAAEGITNSLGIFVAANIAGGSIQISVEAQGYDDAYLSHEMDGSVSVELLLRPLVGGPLMVHAYDTTTFKPVIGAEVTVREATSGSQVASGVTDDQGTFVVDLPGGWYEIDVVADGYSLKGSSVSVDGWGEVFLGLDPRVEGTITLVIRDETDFSPIADVSIVVVSAETGMEAAHGVTDAWGNFTTPTLEGGGYEITAQRDGYAPGFGFVFVQGDTVIGLGLVPQPGALTVHVLDSTTGLPIAGAVVEVQGYDPMPVASGATGVDSVFIAPDLPGGTYTVMVTAGDYFDTSAPVRVAGDAAVDLTMVARLPGVLTVVVRNEVTGEPIRDAWVSVKGDMGVGEVTSGTTDKDGQLITQTLTAGYYMIEVAADAYDSGYAWLLLSGSSEVEIQLRPQVPGRLTVRLVDADTGEPVGKASVVVYDNDWVNYEIGKTRNTGEFRTLELPEGFYYIDVTAPGYLTYVYGAWVHGDTEQVLELSGLAPGSLTVRVIDQATELPVADASVGVYRLDRTEVAAGTTDADGVYPSPVLDAGDKLIGVTAEGYMASGDLYIWVNGATELVVTLEPSTSSTISVDVIAWDTYTGLAGATVVVRDALGGNEVANGVTDEWGNYTASGFPGGDYVVRVTADGYASLATSLRVNGSVTQSVYLEPQEPLAPGAITVKLVSLPSGEPVLDAAVVVVDLDDLSEVAAGTIDGPEGFVTGELPGGDYLLRIDAEFYRSIEVAVTVDGPAQVSLGTELQTTASLRVVPIYVAPGGQVTVSGEGFAPSERVRIAWNGPGGEALADVKATKDGTFSKKVKIPEEATGMSSVVAVGLESGEMGAWFVILTVPGEPSFLP